ncbi:monovalent cation/H+ antiporter subunit D [Cobetia sp. MB87]|uniref:monovalent cation/H+ antiporter subunit D n=1 Tax=Cobetia sp. MB87 TaxID=2588451 RepID=UPI00140871E7|nr:monovalent cation/H+ antiporter subunit D [Cobetia sp. MB87]NHH86888.1 Na(+)/H(+) antiporter subunit D [Cobetia sp. MB87]
MLQHLIVLPIVLPLLVGASLLLSRATSPTLRRTVSLVAQALMVAIAIALVVQASDGTIRYYALGDWQPPFGIVLVLDRLSATMVLLSSLLGLLACLYATAGIDETGSNFHGLFLLQLMGINGAFLTGDLFNLFVFFEVLLIASYALLLHGGSKARTLSALHYVVLNLMGSAFFLIALGILYGVTGTLNMADMAVIVTTLDPGRAGLMEAGGLLLLVVFGLKAAMLPLYFWLPRAYAAASAPVAALFAIMTKVGIYSILRVYSLIFTDNAGALADLGRDWLWWAGLATLVVAMLGVLSARDLRTLVAYLVMVSVGTLLTALGMNTIAADSALLFYLIHSTLVTGGLFLLVDVVAGQRGKAGARIVRSRPLLQAGLLGGLFLIGTAAAAGLPPFSGAIGKALILASATPEQQLWLWPLLLLAGLCSLVACSRAGSSVFWRTSKAEPSGERIGAARGIATGGLISAALMLVIFAGPLANWTKATAEQLSNPAPYLESLLGKDAAPETAPPLKGDVS